jgi:hypothetical protein
MIPINYSEAELCDIIIWRREGGTWDDIAKKLNRKYSSHRSSDAIRKTYERYGSMYDISDEKLLLDTLKSSARKTITSAKQAKTSKAVLQAAITLEDVVSEIKETVKKLKIKSPAPIKFPINDTGKSMTIEALLSDLHIGLRFETFDTKIARKRLGELVRTLLSEIARLSGTYKIDRVIVCLLGDIINSSTMHGHESERDCEIGNSEQVAFAIRVLFEEVFVPLSTLDLEIYVPCVPGNHDRAETNRTFVYPGKFNLTWIIYNALEMLCEQAGFNNIKFDITEETYIVDKIYNDVVLWEHGDCLRGNSKQALENHVQKRQQQIGSLIDFFRMGHFHEYRVYGRGRIVTNASLCGQSSFSKVSGFNSVASQTLNYYIKTKNRPTSFYKSFAVYLGG